MRPRGPTGTAEIMNSDLRRLVHDRLSSEGVLPKNWSTLVLAACDGKQELPPTSAELLGWLGTVEEFVAHLGIART